MSDVAYALLRQVDRHRARAAEHFGVAYEDVTSEQRAVGKALNYAEGYLVDPSLKEDYLARVRAEWDKEDES